jgi:hypothetical protein
VKLSHHFKEHIIHTGHVTEDPDQPILHELQQLVINQGYYEYSLQGEKKAQVITLSARLLHNFACMFWRLH